MKTALAAARFIDGDVAFNLSRMDAYMQRAKARGPSWSAFGGCAYLKNGTVAANLPMGGEGLLVTEIP